MLNAKLAFEIGRVNELLARRKLGRDRGIK